MITFIKFLSVGGVATLIQYIVLVLLVEIFGILPYIATAIGYTISAIFNYLANYYFSFASKANHISAVGKFVVVVLIGLVMNSYVVYIATEVGNINYLIGQVVATAVVAISNYILLKSWAYK